MKPLRNLSFLASCLPIESEAKVCGSAKDRCLGRCAVVVFDICHVRFSTVSAYILSVSFLLKKAWLSVKASLVIVIVLLSFDIE